MLGGYLEFFMKPTLAETYLNLKRELDELIQNKVSGWELHIFLQNKVIWLYDSDVCWQLRYWWWPWYGAANYDKCDNYVYDAKNKLIWHHSIRISKTNIPMHNMNFEHSSCVCESVEFLIPWSISELSPEMVKNVLLEIFLLYLWLIIPSKWIPLV